MDLIKLESKIRENLNATFEDGYSIGISFPNSDRVKLSNGTGDLTIVVEFDNLDGNNLHYCEVKCTYFLYIKVINDMYDCVVNALNILMEVVE